MKKFLGMILLLLLSIVILISWQMNLKRTQNQTYEKKNIIEEESSENVAGLSLEGENGFDETEQLTIADPIQPLFEEKTRWNLFQLAYSYNGKIPYCVGGRFWQQGYPVIDGGIDNRNLPEGVSMGMDSLGYVIWLYRNMFGICDEEMEAPVALLYEKYKINKEQLEVGDIGMATLNSDENHYGVCIGYDHGIPVFTHCDSSPSELYPGGTTRFSYLSASAKRYYMGNRPVDLQYFFRPPNILWEEE